MARCKQRAGIGDGARSTRACSSAIQDALRMHTLDRHRGGVELRGKGRRTACTNVRKLAVIPGRKWSRTRSSSLWQGCPTARRHRQDSGGRERSGIFSNWEDHETAWPTRNSHQGDLAYRSCVSKQIDPVYLLISDLPSKWTR